MRLPLIAAPVTAALLLSSLTAPAQATAPVRLDGTWRLVGYGQDAVIKGDALTLHQTTSISCLPGGTLKRTGSGPGGEARFTDDEGTEILVRRVSPTRLRLNDPGSVGDVALDRLRALPSRCGKPTPKDPVTTFDVFWATFAEHYPFFAAKKVDWNATRARYRPQVTAATSPEKLFSIFRRMIEPLHDAHTGVADLANKRTFGGHRPGTRRHTEALHKRVDTVTRKAVGVPLRSWANGNIDYADLPGRLGYLRVNGFIGYAGDNATYAQQQAALDEALNEIFTANRVRTLKGLVIDVRYNGGGHDPLGLRIASRLTDRPYVAYRKRAPGPPFQTIRVTPSDRPRYRGPVAVLTSGLSVSAAETFTLAMTGRSPAPLRVGATTQSVFSDIMLRTLPNGWLTVLGNEDYRAPDGTSYEGRGVPPTHPTPVFTEAELGAGRDSALARARGLLIG